MIGEPPKGEFEELEPRIVKEVWNSYQLEDGTRIQARTILMKVFWPKGTEVKPGVEVQIAGSFNNMVVVFAPPKLKGKPNPSPPSPPELRGHKMEEMGVVDSKEEWNLYKLPGDLPGIKVKMVVSSIYRVVGVFDQQGDPYYIVNSTQVVGPSSQRDIVTP